MFSHLIFTIAWSANHLVSSGGSFFYTNTPPVETRETTLTGDTISFYTDLTNCTNIIRICFKFFNIFFFRGIDTEVIKSRPGAS